MGRNLLCGVRERVEGVIDFLAKNLVLNRDNRNQKDVVERFGFDADVKLLHSKGEATDELLDGTNDEVEAGLHEPTKLSEAFNNADFGGADGEDARDAHDCDGLVESSW